ncbi:hypothetical protein OY671_009293, partial [Metschnikowia pulcherrima]
MCRRLSGAAHPVAVSADIAGAARAEPASSAVALPCAFAFGTVCALGMQRIAHRTPIVSAVAAFSPSAHVPRLAVATSRTATMGSSVATATASASTSGASPRAASPPTASPPVASAAIAAIGSSVARSVVFSRPARGRGQPGGFSHEVLRQRSWHQLNAGQPLDIAQIRLLIGRAEADRHAIGAGAHGAADASDASFGHVGQLAVSHMAP